MMHDAATPFSSRTDLVLSCSKLRHHDKLCILESGSGASPAPLIEASA
jgi:hypothetical protein